MILKKLLLVLLISTFFISCEDYLEIQPLDEYADDAVWNNDPALIQSFVNNIYSGLGQTGVRVMNSTYADETMLTFGWDADAVTNSLITPTSYFRFNNTPDQSGFYVWRSEEHTSELQSRENLVCRLLLEKKNKQCTT